MARTKFGPVVPGLAEHRGLSSRALSADSGSVWLRRLGVAAVLALSGAATILSAAELVRSARYLAVLIEAGRLGSSGTGSSDSLLSRRADLALRVASNGCSGHLDSAASQVAVAHLLRQNAARDYDTWLDAAALANRTVRHNLSCAPGDGVALAHLALVERLSSLSVPQVLDLLVASQRLAPSEPAALVARIGLWREIPIADMPAAETARRADLDALLRNAWPPEIMALLRPRPPFLDGIVAELASELPADRAQFLRRRGLFESAPTHDPTP